MNNEELLNEFFNDAYYNFPEFIDLIPYFTKMSDEFLKVTSPLLREEVDIKYETMEIETTIKLVREFLNTIDLKYLQQFDKALYDGTFDIFLPEDDLIEREDYPVITPKPKAGINIPVTKTEYDGLSIIHEFFHYLNDEEILSYPRELFTEMISIYFEIRYSSFLIEKGYGSKCYSNQIFDRINNTFDCANSLYYWSAVLDVYNNLGKVNKNNIKFLDEYRKLFKGEIFKIISEYKSEYLGENLNSYLEALSYVFGTLLVMNLLKEPQISDIRMKRINDNINKLNINDILNILNTNINEIDIWAVECQKRLKEVLGDVYGEDYMHSRSNRRRKN